MWNTLEVAKKVLRYLKGIINFDILYTDAFDFQLEGYSNYDWAGNPDDRNLLLDMHFTLV